MKKTFEIEWDLMNEKKSMRAIEIENALVSYYTGEFKVREIDLQPKQEFCECGGFHHMQNYIVAYPDGRKCNYCNLFIRPTPEVKRIEELSGIYPNIDIQNNDDLFNIILENRHKLNELIKDHEALKRAFNQLKQERRKG